LRAREERREQRTGERFAPIQGFVVFLKSSSKDLARGRVKRNERVKDVGKVCRQLRHQGGRRREKKFEKFARVTN
jgi:hypothetical protein